MSASEVLAEAEADSEPQSVTLTMRRIRASA
jgi:hypothetical protein